MVTVVGMDSMMNDFEVFPHDLLISLHHREFVLHGEAPIRWSTSDLWVTSMR